MLRPSVRALAAVCGVCVLSLAMGPTAIADDGRQGRASHVLLISVDGLHQTDLAWYVGRHPGSALATLVGGGVEFTNAMAPVPSDSFPGMVGQVTGGNPSSTGVYYDDSYNHALLPAGTTDCAHATPGVEVTYFEAAAKDPARLDSGAGLAGLPGSILSLTGNPTTLIDPAQLPVDPATCRPVYPHSYLRVNTVFEVARAAGLRTAWSDKHAAYEILNGPSGTGVQDLFTPEINSNAAIVNGQPIDWTKDNALTQKYDSYKVQAVLNQIQGLDHSGTTRVGTPAIFGMNFQTVSTAQKLAVSGGEAGGYLADGVTPGPVLNGALDFINSKVGALVAALKAGGLDSSTVVILSAKHGQSPEKPSQLTRIPDGPIIDAINAGWNSLHPHRPALVGQSTNDDGVIMWLTDRSPAAVSFAQDTLWAQSGTGNDINGNPRGYVHSGLSRIYAGNAAAAYFHVAKADERVPDIFGIAQQGVVYTGGRGKIAEHGGAHLEDRAVALVVSGKPIHGHRVDSSPVGTIQIAPTILNLLGLDPEALQAVRIEHTATLRLGQGQEDRNQRQSPAADARG